MSNSVENWRKRTQKKGPFYIMSMEPIEQKSGDFSEQWWKYKVIWKEGDKTKIGYLSDGMFTRYGISTYGVLTGTSISGFWQASSGALTEIEMNDMLKIAKGDIDPCQPILLVKNLKNLRL